MQRLVMSNLWKKFLSVSSSHFSFIVLCVCTYFTPEHVTADQLAANFLIIPMLNPLYIYCARHEFNIISTAKKITISPTTSHSRNFENTNKKKISQRNRKEKGNKNHTAIRFEQHVNIQITHLVFPSHRSASYYLWNNHDVESNGTFEHQFLCIFQRK